MRLEIYPWALPVCVITNVHLIAVRTVRAYASVIPTVVKVGNASIRYSSLITVSSSIFLLVLIASRTHNVQPENVKVVIVSVIVILIAHRVKNASSPFSAPTIVRLPSRLERHARKTHNVNRITAIGENVLANMTIIARAGRSVNVASEKTNASKWMPVRKTELRGAVNYSAGIENKEGCCRCVDVGYHGERFVSRIKFVAMRQ